MAADEIRVPAEHDRVLLHGQNGVLTVVDVDATAKTVSLQFVTGDGPLVRDIPWADLAYMADESGEQAASQVVEDKPEK
jgi:hypothetical protein